MAESYAATTWPVSGGTANRFYVLTGLGSVSAPSAGGDIDGCRMSSGSGNGQACPACKGAAFQVEAGASFSSSVDLQTDSSGRAIQHTTGVAVARALQSAAGSGSVVWAVFK